MRMGNSDWGRGGGQNSGDNRDDWQNLRKIQWTVATSTFSAIAFMGMCCTCLYLGCCRPKRQTRIRGGQTWNTDANSSVPTTRGIFMNHPLDSNRVNLNPYLISSNFYSDNLNTGNGFYHPSVGIPDEKPPAESTYKPFFAKMDWQPPDPPAYETLSFANPIYNDEKKDTEKIKEKILTSSLATSDPNKRLGSSNNPHHPIVSQECPVYSTEDKKMGCDQATTGRSSSAPPESIVSLEAKDSGHPYPNGINVTSSAEDESSKPGGLEEFKPPPYNPSYMTYQPPTT